MIRSINGTSHVKKTQSAFQALSPIDYSSVIHGQPIHISWIAEAMATDRWFLPAFIGSLIAISLSTTQEFKATKGKYKGSYWKTICRAQKKQRTKERKTASWWESHFCPHPLCGSGTNHVGHCSQGTVDQGQGSFWFGMNAKGFVLPRFFCSIKSSNIRSAISKIW